MINPEAFPVVGGLVLGSVARLTYHATRRVSYVLALIVLAFCATVASGEFRQSWGYLLADLAIVSTAAVGAYVLVGLAARRSTRQG